MAETKNDEIAIAGEEWRELITICDKLPQRAKHSPATPFAVTFTEQGVSMHVCILNSNSAISKVNGCY
ncbi:ORF6N domain-containing protein [Parapedobacter soli]|uniref:ORF6N domain-containing protein n=1 Tax=Parapedobacter soli TaxID=416955 RepID=UPI0021C6D1D2|nr:ORF6N domain-containing protein [Parapedobacter soli]